jgi:isopentenyldiphosphate isomerase
MGDDRNENGKEMELRENYRVMLKGEEVGKEVRYWVALVRGEQELKVQEMEVAGAEWMGWDEAENRISFESGKVMVRRVREGLGR